VDEPRGLPGSFDPITNGHLDVLRRAVAVFDRVVVAVLENPRKSPLLATADRVEVIRASLTEAGPELAGRADVQTFDGLTVDFCHRVGAGFMVRGLRAVSDFETEMQLAHNNRILARDVDTVFFMTSLEQGYVSSSLVKEIARFGGDVSAMVPGPAAAALARIAGRP
jgi:pantetheine-phosphate adenylyltransferase